MRRIAVVVAVVVTSVLGAGVAAVLAASRSAPAPPARPAAAATHSARPEPAPEAPAHFGEPDWRDPLAPHRPLTLGAELSGDWPNARPAKIHQYSRSVEERGGVLPCEASDPGFGVHAEWTHTRPLGQFIAPRGDFLDTDGGFDLFVHFHGHRPARKELVRTGEDVVLLGVSKGPGADYGPDFSDPRLFQKLVDQVQAKLARRVGRAAHVRHIGLTSWSRGYEAIAQILTQPLASKVDALILIDSLHASRTPAQARRQLAPFVAFAKKAAMGQAFLFASHSSIDTPAYASSTESVHRLVHAVGGTPRHAARRDPLGLQLVELFSKGDFHARGYAGNGKLDHCAHFGVYAEAVRAAVAHWRGD